MIQLRATVAGIVRRYELKVCFRSDPADWNQYRLCHATDVACSSKSSLYAAGAVSQATDGADLGMNPGGINNAQRPGSSLRLFNTVWCEWAVSGLRSSAL